MLNDPTHGLLGATLAVAVPLRIEEMRARGGPSPADLEHARGFADVLAEKGDILQFKSPKPGETAAVFNGLARAMAVLAFCPGGVKFDGTRYEANPQPESENDMAKQQKLADDHPARHKGPTPRKPAVPFTVPAGEDWLRMVHMGRAELPGFMIAVRVRNSYTFYGNPDVEAASKLCDLTPFKASGPGIDSATVPACEFPAADLDRYARILHGAGKRLALIEAGDNDHAVPLDLPPAPEEQAAIRANYAAIQIRHVRGECIAFWTTNAEGKWAAHKGRKVKGVQVGPFVVHVDEKLGYAITHELKGVQVGQLALPGLADAKLFALLLGWNHSWEYETKQPPDAEIAHVSALLKHWRANRWDLIAKLCPIESEPLANDPEPAPSPVKSIGEETAADLARDTALANVVTPGDATKLMTMFDGLPKPVLPLKTIIAYFDFDAGRVGIALAHLEQTGRIRRLPDELIESLSPLPL